MALQVRSKAVMYRIGTLLIPLILMFDASLKTYEENIAFLQKSSNPTVQLHLQLQLRHGTKNTIDVALQTNKNCLVPRRTLPGSYLRKISVYRWGGGFYDWGKIGEKRNLSVAIFHLFRYKYWKVRFKYGANECLKIEWNMFYRCGLRHFV